MGQTINATDLEELVVMQLCTLQGEIKSFCFIAA